MAITSSGTATLRPAFRIAIDGNDATQVLTGRLISLTLRDLRGMEADTLALEIDDADGRVRIPDKGAEISLAIGYAGALRDKGWFLVDTTGHSDPPDRIHITAHSADFRGSLKIAKERSWHDQTLRELIAQLAQDHALVPAVDRVLAAIRIPHIDQTNESDAHFLTRLGQRYDAIATVKDEHLLFVRRGRGITASGRPLPTLVLHRSEGDQHQYEEPDRDSRYSGVRTFYDDMASGRRLFVIVGEEGYLRTLRDPYPTKGEAQDATIGEWGRLHRAEAHMDLHIARGRPDLMPEQPTRLIGWKEQISARDWVTTEVTQTIDSGGGFTTAVQLEVRLTE